MKNILIGIGLLAVVIPTITMADIKLTKQEKVEVIKSRITKSVTAGGNSGYYDVVDPQKLAEYLYELQTTK